MRWWEYFLISFGGLLVMGFVYSIISRFMRRFDIGGTIEPHRPNEEVSLWVDRNREP